MNRTVFVQLCHMVKIDDKLKASRYLQINEQFRRSGETISKHFNNVVNDVIRSEKELFKFKKLEPISKTSTDETWKWLKVFYLLKSRAIYETYISVHVQRKTNQHKEIEKETNVLVACALDMQFIFVLLDWEGSV
uniref:Uncharacterized protein n=1 Tax=Lactuca sativa TaxID=4236 RepID=A0A9R1XU66_LACSA|nr:hypothetical protein LSAT_V11C300103600 [Lactuca sativa]